MAQIFLKKVKDSSREVLYSMYIESCSKCYYHLTSGCPEGSCNGFHYEKINLKRVPVSDLDISPVCSKCYFSKTKSPLNSCKHIDCGGIEGFIFVEEK